MSLARIFWGAAVLTLFVVIVAPGCSSFSSDRPPIADTTLTRLMQDIHLSVARVNTGAPAPEGFRDSILARYNVTSAQFEATLEYYSRHPEELKSMYGPIVDSLKALQYKRQTTAPRPPDSLRKRSRRRPSND